jgi:hypothetical protein
MRKFREINQRYRTPRLAFSPVVRYALIGLRSYLLALVLLMLYKFVQLVHGA